MSRSPVLRVLAGLLACTVTSTAQVSHHVRFAEDVQSILRENCRNCHGPEKQKGGMRLDRRGSVMKLGTRRLVPGNSANSMIYARLIGEEYGPQMPPKGPLPEDQIKTIREWIEQGAEWPDALANDAEPPPVDPAALAMIESLRLGNRSAFLEAAKEDPERLNARGPDGSSPFMYAVLYSDPATLAKLLKWGANPNHRNDARATPLIWAARDFAKTRLLVEHGADVNAKSDDQRTPLMVAARRPGAAALVQYLLDHGANPNPNDKPIGESSPLIEAITASDPATVRLLIQRGADAKAAAEAGLNNAFFADCDECLQLILPAIDDPKACSIALGTAAVFGNPKAIRMLLDRGADVNGVDPFGRTPLMYAAISDLLPLEAIKLLVERGANVNAVNGHKKAGDAGLTVLDIANLNGRTPVVEFLERAGAKPGPVTPVERHPRKHNSIREAVQASLPLVQRADSFFAKNAGCTSCHNNSIEAMAVGAARGKGLPINEAARAEQIQFNLEELRALRHKFHQGYEFAVGDMFSDFILGYQLVGLHAVGCPPNLDTDAVALLIQSRQRPNGEWHYPRADTRPPICVDYISQTALAMRALQLYAPVSRKAEFEKSVRKAAAWLAQAQSANNEDRAWRLTGLTWAGASKGVIRKALDEVLRAQRPDGGWSDLPTLPSTPFAAGRSLVALHTAGLPVSHPAYQRGVQYLLGTQEEDGSWYTKTRALGFQPYFDGSFPHGYDQWMSAAGTSWATMALTFALPDSAPVSTAFRRR